MTEPNTLSDENRKVLKQVGLFGHSTLDAEEFNAFCNATRADERARSARAALNQKEG